MALLATAWGDSPGERVILEIPGVNTWWDDEDYDIALTCAREAFARLWGYDAIGWRTDAVGELNDD